MVKTSRAPVTCDLSHLSFCPLLVSALCTSVMIHFVLSGISVCFPQECTKQRMFNGTYPTSAFINHYDNMEDINRRKHRTKLKVKGGSHKERLKHRHVTVAALITALSIKTLVREHGKILFLFLT